MNGVLGSVFNCLTIIVCYLEWSLINHIQDKTIIFFKNGHLFAQETVAESQYPDDPEGEVTFFVERIQGTQGTVEVLWELEPAGRLDLSPTSGTLIFSDVSILSLCSIS